MKSQDILKTPNKTNEYESPIGLDENKVKMETAFSRLYFDGSADNPDSGSTIYKNAYHAYYDAAEKKLNEGQAAMNASEDSDIQDMLKNDNSMDSAREQLQKDAHEFAKCFTTAMSEVLEEIKTQIDAHCRSMIIKVDLEPNIDATGTTLQCDDRFVKGKISANNLSYNSGITVK